MKALGHGLFKVIQWLACYVVIVVVGFASAVVLAVVSISLINAVVEQAEKTERRIQYEYELSN